MLDDLGYGIVEKDRKKYRIPNLLVNEKAKIRFFNNGYGKVLEYIETSPERVKPVCPRFEDCGGCQLQHIDYQRQLELKTERIKNLLKKNNYDPALCLPIIGMKNPYFYRNKVQMVISEKNHKVMSGLYEENTHKIVNIDRCVIQDDKANEIIRTCRKLMQTQRIEPYDEDKKTGLIRHIFVRRSPVTEQILVALVTIREMFPGRNNFVKALRAAHPEITTIVQNINSRKTSIVLGDFDRILYGKGTIIDETLGKKFLISTQSFYQVNHKQTELVYQKALEFAKPKATDFLLELYCGVGTLALIFSDHVKQAVGVDISKEAIHDAIVNSKLNGARNVRFYASDAKDFMETYSNEDVTVDILLVDPPREGLDPEVVESIIRLKPKKIIYVSCNPDSLIRDIGPLLISGYGLKNIQPVDMFPHSYHVESVTLLSIK